MGVRAYGRSFRLVSSAAGSRILFHVVADGDEQALLQAAEFVVRGLEHAMTGRPPERKGSRRRGAPSSD